MDEIEAAAAWLGGTGPTRETSPPIRWITLTGDEQSKQLARSTLARDGIALASPGAPAAARTAKAMGIPVTSLARLIYRTDDNGRAPKRRSEIACEAVLVVGAEAIGRDQIGDLLATGLRVLLATTGRPSQEGFLNGRTPEHDATRPRQGPKSTVLGSKAVRIGTMRLADGTLELICMEDQEDLGLHRNDVFRPHR